MNEDEQFEQDRYTLVCDFIKLFREICTGTSMDYEETKMLANKAVKFLDEAAILINGDDNG